jgi:hypothetical protein
MSMVGLPNNIQMRKTLSTQHFQLPNLHLDAVLTFLSSISLPSPSRPGALLPGPFAPSRRSTPLPASLLRRAVAQRRDRLPVQTRRALLQSFVFTVAFIYANPFAMLDVFRSMLFPRRCCP